MLSDTQRSSSALTLTAAVDEWARVVLEEGAALVRQAEKMNSELPVREVLNRALIEITARLNRGGQVLVLGLGKSGKIAQKIAATLSSTGSRATYLHPTEALHGDLGLAQSHDVAWAISHSGNTAELVAVADVLRQRGIFLIGQGGHAQSPLARMCHLWIDAPLSREACPLQLAPMSSTALALALGDGLAAALMRMRGFEPSQFLANHPGGSLGARLKTTVQDWMVPIERVGRVGINEGIDAIVAAATEFKTGAVLVVDSSLSGAPKLLGIITDGDLRRALLHRERIFTMAAKDFMTSQPTVARHNLSTHDALRVMEERPSQITVLPVLDSQDHVVGLVRLHDLVQTF